MTEELHKMTMEEKIHVQDHLANKLAEIDRARADLRRFGLPKYQDLIDQHRQYLEGFIKALEDVHVLSSQEVGRLKFLVEESKSNDLVIPGGFDYWHFCVRLKLQELEIDY